MAVKQSQRSRSRQTTPQSPPRQSASLASPRDQPRITKSRGIHKTPPPQKQNRGNLATLAEEHRDSDDGDEDEDDEDEDDDDQIEIVQPTAPSNASFDNDGDDDEDDIDDSSSNGETQLESLDADLIVDNLVTLHQASDHIISLFTPAKASNIVKELDDPLSKLNKRLLNFTGQLRNVRPAYGDGSYIDVRLVIRKISQDANTPDGPWKPDAVLQLANLSDLVTSLVRNNDAEIYDTLERMYNTFPEPFGALYTTQGMTRYTPQLVQETILFGIDLRTQFFLKCVERHKREPPFDPDGILQQVFFDEDDILRGFQPSEQETSPETEDAIVQRLTEIRKFFKKSSKNPVDIQRLKQKYSWQQFLLNSFRWISLRGQELNNQIHSQGGVAAIQDRLENGALLPYPGIAATTPMTQEAVQHAKVNTDKSRLPTVSTPEVSVVGKRYKQLKAIKAIQARKDWLGDDQNEVDEEEVKHTQPREGSIQETPVRSQHQLRNIPDSSSAELLRDTSGTQADNESSEEDEELEVIAEDANAVSVEAEDRANGSEIPGPQDDDYHNFIDGDDHAEEPDVVSQQVEETRQSSPPIPTQSSIVPTQQTLAVLAVAKEQNALSNKENATRRFTDRQPNATRMSWEDSQTREKRPHTTAREDNDEDNEDDESEEYETDVRPSKRVRAVSTTNRDVEDDWMPGGDDDAEPRMEEEEDDGAQAVHGTSVHRPTTGSQPPPSAQATSSRPPLKEIILTTREPPPVDQPRPRQQQQARAVRSPSPLDIPSSTAEQHLDVNARAKATVRLKTFREPDSRRDRPHAARRPWTYPETERLFEMIETHGCQWAYILTADAAHEDGPQLQDRNQVQLKDKARNLKMDYLKAGEELPPGFACVTIKATDKQLLRKLGMPYE